MRLPVFQERDPPAAAPQRKAKELETDPTSSKQFLRNRLLAVYRELETKETNEQRSLAFAMCTHPRLGDQTCASILELPSDVFEKICAAAYIYNTDVFKENDNGEYIWTRFTPGFRL